MSSFDKFLIAHLIADFLLQNNWIALNKSKRFLPLIVHGIIYGLVFMIFFSHIALWKIFIISLIHCLIDYFSLGNKWLKLIRGRHFNSSYSNTIEDPIMLSYYISFSSLVYSVVDFLFHFMTTYPLLIF